MPSGFESSFESSFESLLESPLPRALGEADMVGLEPPGSDEAADEAWPVGLDVASAESPDAVLPEAPQPVSATAPSASPASTLLPEDVMFTTGVFSTRRANRRVGPGVLGTSSPTTRPPDAHPDGGAT